MAQTPPATGALDRLASFRVIYAGVFAYILLSVAFLELSEWWLDGHFRREIDRATQVSPADGRVAPQIHANLDAVVRDSPWVKLGGARVRVLALGADGRTPLYLGGEHPPPPPDLILSPFEEADQLLPPIVTAEVTLPLDSLYSGAVWVGFGAVLLSFLFYYTRSLATREEALVAEAVAARDATAERARSIQTELEKVRRRLTELEPAERAHLADISSLEHEREGLKDKLRELSQREEELRNRVARSSELEQERQALEDLLEEAVQDLDQKESEIRDLSDRLKRADKAPKASRSRASEQIAKRMNALYRNLEIEERAIRDIAALGDESLRLRAEEALKRLDEDHEKAGARRKVGGLPPQLTIFELGFAGKGRIYYARGRQRNFRVLAVGGKASQKADLEYLSRLSLG